MKLLFWGAGGQAFCGMNDREALGAYEQAFTIYKGLGLKKGIAYQLAGMGTVYDRRGDKEKAREYFEQALAILQRDRTQNWRGGSAA